MSHWKKLVENKVKNLQETLSRLQKKSDERNLSQEVTAILIMTPSYPISGFRGRTIEFFGL